MLLINKINKFIIFYFLCFIAWFFLVNNASFLFLNNLNGYNTVIFWKLLFMLNDVQYNLFVFLVLLIFYFNKKTLHISNIIYYLIYFFFLKQENIILYNFLSNYWILNITLTNGLCLIHPLCVYYVYIYVINNITTKFNIFYCVKYLKFSSKLILINLLSLILGSWWAQQELNWGGWWNWDFVELILLIFLIKNVIIHHIISLKKSLLISKLSITLFLYLVIFFVFVRWDILNSVHSFNTLNFLERYINYIICILLVFLLTYLISVYTHYNLYKHNITFIDNVNKLTLTNLYLNFFILLIIFFFIYNIYLTTANETDFLELTKYLRFIMYITFLLSSFLFLNKKKVTPLLLVLLLIFFTYNYFIVIISLLSVVYNFKLKLKLRVLHLITIILALIILLFSTISDYYFSFNKSDFFGANKIISVSNFKLAFESSKITNQLNDNQLSKLNIFVLFFENFTNVNDLKIFNMIPFFFIINNVLFTQQYSSLNQYMFTVLNTNIFLILFLSLVLVLVVSFKVKIKIIY